MLSPAVMLSKYHTKLSAAITELPFDKPQVKWLSMGHRMPGWEAHPKILLMDTVKDFSKVYASSNKGIYVYWNIDDWSKFFKTSDTCNSLSRFDAFQSGIKFWGPRLFWFHK